MKALVNWALSGAVVAICIVAGTREYHSYAARPSPRPPAYQIGDRVSMPGLDLSGHELTVLVYLAAHHNPDWRESIDWTYYRTIQVPHDRSRSQLVVITNDPVAMESEFATHGVAVDKVTHVEIAKTGIHAAPTTLVLDPAGTVLKVWPGIPSSRDQQQIARMIGFGLSDDRLRR